MQNKLSRWMIWSGAVGLCLMGLAAQIAFVRSVGCTRESVMGLAAYVVVNVAGGVFALALGKHTDEKLWPNALGIALGWAFSMLLTYAADALSWMLGCADPGEAIWAIRREMDFVLGASRFFGGVTVDMPPNCIPHPVGVSVLTTGVCAYGRVFMSACGFLFGLLLLGFCLVIANVKTHGARWASALVSLGIAIPFAMSVTACCGCRFALPMTTPFVGDGCCLSVLCWAGVGLVLNNISHVLERRTDNRTIWRLILVCGLLIGISGACRLGADDHEVDFRPTTYRFEKRVKAFAGSTDECRLIFDRVVDRHGRVLKTEKRLARPTFEVPVDFPDSWLRPGTEGNGKEKGDEHDLR